MYWAKTEDSIVNHGEWAKFLQGFPIQIEKPIHTSEPDVVVKNEKLTLTSVIAMIVFFLFFCFLE